MKQRYRDVLEQAKVRNRARKLDSTVLRRRHCRVDNVQSYREDKEDTDKSHQLGSRQRKASQLRFLLVRRIYDLPHLVVSHQLPDINGQAPWCRHQSDRIPPELMTTTTDVVPQVCFHPDDVDRGNSDRILFPGRNGNCQNRSQICDDLDGIEKFSTYFREVLNSGIE